MGVVAVLIVVTGLVAALGGAGGAIAGTLHAERTPAVIGVTLWFVGLGLILTGMALYPGRCSMTALPGGGVLLDAFVVRPPLPSWQRFEHDAFWALPWVRA